MNLPGKILATLRDEFYLVLMEENVFAPLYDENVMKAFDKKNYLTQIDLLMTNNEKAKQEKLSKRMGDLFKLYLGVFTKTGEFIGWHKGEQQSAENYYMRISGVLPAYQNRGIYTAMLPHIMNICIDEGFQILSSLHALTNNAILIPKLKAGFIIVSTEISDKFGTVARLEYHPNEKRRELFHYRSGQIKFNPLWEKLRPKFK